jgi:hypothetical protein
MNALAQSAPRAGTEPIRKFRTFGSEGIYDDGTIRAAVYFELLRRRGVSLAWDGELLDVGAASVASRCTRRAMAPP